MEEKLQKLESVKFKVVVSKKNNIFTLFIPEIGVYGESSNLDEAYKRLNENKLSFFKEAIRAKCDGYFNFDKEEDIRVGKGNGKGVMSKWLIYSLLLIVFFSSVSYIIFNKGSRYLNDYISDKKSSMIGKVESLYTPKNKERVSASNFLFRELSLLRKFNRRIEALSEKDKELFYKEIKTFSENFYFLKSAFEDGMEVSKKLGG